MGGAVVTVARKKGKRAKPIKRMIVAGYSLICPGGCVGLSLLQPRQSHHEQRRAATNMVVSMHHDLGSLTRLLSHCGLDVHDAHHAFSLSLYAKRRGRGVSHEQRRAVAYNETHGITYENGNSYSIVQYTSASRPRSSPSATRRTQEALVNLYWPGHSIQSVCTLSAH